MTGNEYPNYRRDWRDRLWFVVGRWRNFVALARVWRLRFRRWLAKERPIRWILTERRHQALIAAERKATADRIYRLNSSHEQELRELGADFQRVLPGLVRCTLKRPTPPYRDYRVEVALNEMFIHEALRQGGDERIIRYMGESIGRQVEQAIRGINVVRYEDTPRAWETERGRPVRGVSEWGE